MVWGIVIAAVLASYLLGSIPSGYIFVRLARGKDIRTVGSRNVGALNAYHQVGAWGGLTVLLADIGKGAAAALLPVLPGVPHWSLYLTATAVVIGHNWPVFLGFRGGKGVATIMGVSLALVPLLTLIAAVPTVVVILLSRNAILGVGAGFITLNTLLIFTRQPAGLIALCLFLTVLVTVTYVVAIWGQITTAIKTRHWRGIFYGANMNP